MNRIRAARQARGWTQADLAERARISPRTIHAIEKGQDCRQATKRKLLLALAIPWTERAEYFPPAHAAQSAIRVERGAEEVRETA